MRKPRMLEQFLMCFAIFTSLCSVCESSFAIDKNCKVWCDDEDKESRNITFCSVDETFSPPLDFIDYPKQVKIDAHAICDDTPARDLAISILWNLTGNVVRTESIRHVVIEIRQTFDRGHGGSPTDEIGVSLQEKTCNKSYNFHWITHGGKVKLVKAGSYVLNLRSSLDEKNVLNKPIGISEYLDRDTPGCEVESAPENTCIDGYLCGNLNCTPLSKFCDGVDDCGDNSDELKVIPNATSGANDTVCISRNWPYSRNARPRVCLLPENQISKSPLVCKKELGSVVTIITIGLVFLVITLILLIAVLTSTRICVEEPIYNNLKVAFIVNPGILDSAVKDRYTEVATALEELDNVEELRFNLRNTLDTPIIEWLHTNTQWADVVIVASAPDETEIDSRHYYAFNNALMTVINELTMVTNHERIIAIRIEDIRRHSNCPLHKSRIFKTIQVQSGSEDQILRKICKPTKYGTYSV